LRPFYPLFRNPHLATLAASLWPRKLDEARFPVTARLYRPEPEVQILIHTQAPEKPIADVMLVHGLEGSSDSGYMRSMAQTLLEAGFATHRMNIRTCGGTEFLCDTLYHAGLTTDIFAYLMDLDRQRRTPVFLVGFSLGGNMVLKLAGEMGDDAHRVLAGVVAVSTPLDLAACARRLNAFQNRIYQWHFVSSMKKRLELRRKILPPTLGWDRLKGLRTIYQLDDVFTGPSFGFSGAEHYYATQSAAQFLERIRVPAVLVHAQDDPMIPWEAYAQPAFETNPNLHLNAVACGGHIGFLSRDLPRFWVDDVVSRILTDLRNN
jgi:predicted alpha/beta-fold hydrolase